jgi:hypothetical protein
LAFAAASVTADAAKKSKFAASGWLEVPESEKVPFSVIE